MGDDVNEYIMEEFLGDMKEQMELWSQDDVSKEAVLKEMQRCIDYFATEKALLQRYYNVTTTPRSGQRLAMTKEELIKHSRKRAFPPFGDKVYARYIFKLNDNDGVSRNNKLF